MTDRRRAAILALCCASGTIHVMGLTSLNVALPSIQRDLGLGDAILPWLVSGYSITFAGFVLVGGRLADLFGPRRTYLIGTTIFAVAALLAAWFGAAGPIIAARSLQGIGAALATPAALSVLTTTFPADRERSRALALWTSSSAGGAALGLVLGGLLTSVLGWRWIFLATLPLCVLMVAGALSLLPRGRHGSEPRRLDLAGAVTVTGALVLFVLGLTLAERHSWSGAPVLGSFAASLCLLAAFIAVELRSVAPLVPPRVFHMRGLRAAGMLSLVQSAVTFAVAVVASLAMQRGLGYSPLVAGLAFLPLDVGVVAGAALSHRLVRRLGVRISLGAGGAMLVCGPLLLNLLSGFGGYATALLPGIAVLGLGTGLVSLPTSIVAFAGIPRSEAGLASGLLTATRQVGVVVGVTLLATVVAASTSGAHVSDSAAQAMREGASNAYLFAACLAAASVLVGLAVVRQPQAATGDRPVEDESLPVEA